MFRGTLNSNPINLQLYSIYALRAPRFNPLWGGYPYPSRQDIGIGSVERCPDPLE
jgi:hypothetical protein